MIVPPNDSLRKGRTVETGTHEALLAQLGLYSAMWRQQVGERDSPALPPQGMPAPEGF
jgi:hypothetical protein